MKNKPGKQHGSFPLVARRFVSQRVVSIALLLFFITPVINAQHSLVLGASIRVITSQLMMTDPTFAARAAETSGWGFSGGFGVTARFPLKSPMLSIGIQDCFQTDGTGGIYYYGTSDPRTFVRIYDRYTNMNFNAGIRLTGQYKPLNGVYFEPGIGGRAIFSIKALHANVSSAPTPGSFILEAADHESFTFGLYGAIGKNILQKTDVELAFFYDLSPVISRPEVQAYLMTASLNVRYYFGVSTE